MNAQGVPVVGYRQPAARRRGFTGSLAEPDVVRHLAVCLYGAVSTDAPTVGLELLAVRLFSQSEIRGGQGSVNRRLRAMRLLTRP
jgi:hypothetical protein